MDPTLFAEISERRAELDSSRFKPFDILSETTMQRLSQAEGHWNPLRVEFLADLLSTRMGDCLRLRDKGLALEVQYLDFVYRYDSILESVRFNNEILKLITANEPQLDSNRVGGAVSEDYWKQKADTQSASSTLNEKLARDRLAWSETDGSGANLLSRLSFLKASYDDRLVECYRIAHSLRGGLENIFQLSDLPPFPTATTTGFLDALALWTGRVLDRIDLAVQRRSELTLGFALGGEGGLLDTNRQYYRQRAFSSVLESEEYLHFEFSEGLLKQTIFPRANFSAQPPYRMWVYSNPLVKAAAVSMVGSDREFKDDLWTVRIDLPTQYGPYEPYVVAPCHYLREGEAPDLTTQPRVDNSRPWGLWRMRFSRNSVSRHLKPSDATTANAVLFLRLSVG